MRYAVWLLVILLVYIHQDNWFWEDGTLVFGFMPIGLFYHCCISIAASVVWFLATRHCWTPDLEQSNGQEGAAR